MKKHGFTLIELLAVIAILAMIVILAMPAVLNMFNKTKVSSFQNEVKIAYKTYHNKFLSDIIDSPTDKKILYTNVCTSVNGIDTIKSLDLLGDSALKYYILTTNDGKAINIRITNGKYSYVKKATNVSNSIKLENIDVENDNEVELTSDITSSFCPSSEGTYEGETLSPVTYLYAKRKTNYSIGTRIMVNNVNVFDNFEAAQTDSIHFVPAFVVDDNNFIIESYIAFKYNDNIYYLKGIDTSAHESNKALLDSLFPGKCDYYDVGTATERYTCWINAPGKMFRYTTRPDGYVDIANVDSSDFTAYFCKVFSDGTSNCDWDLFG